MDMYAKAMQSGWVDKIYEDDEDFVLKIRDEKGEPPAEAAPAAAAEESDEPTPEEIKNAEDEENDNNLEDPDDNSQDEGNGNIK